MGTSVQPIYIVKFKARLLEYQNELCHVSRSRQVDVDKQTRAVVFTRLEVLVTWIDITGLLLCHVNT